MLKHEIAVHVKKTRFSEKDIQQTYSAITCIECKKRLFSIKFNNHLDENKVAVDARKKNSEKETQET